MRNHWFGQIQCLLCQKSKDLNEKVAGIWKKMVRIWKNGRILNGLWFGSSFTGFEIKNQQPTRWGRVSKVRTCTWLLKSSDRVVAGWTPSGRTGWVGCRFPWTPLSETLMEYLAKLCANLLPSLLQWEHRNFEYVLENAMASWMSGSTETIVLPPAFKESMINSG